MGGAQAYAMQQAQMPTYTHMGDQRQQSLQIKDAPMPTHTGMMGQTNMGQAAMPTQSWSAGSPTPFQQEYSDTQAGMQTMVLEQPPAMQQASMQTMVLEQPPAMQQASMQT